MSLFSFPEMKTCSRLISHDPAIIVVLYLYDQQRPPKWPLDITLNSLLALLSTISKAAFMISLAEVMSQWKWNMFSTSKGRPVHDFYLIDLASRGFLGSCRLVGRFKWRYVKSLLNHVSDPANMPFSVSDIQYHSPASSPSSALSHPPSHNRPSASRLDPWGPTDKPKLE